MINYPNEELSLWSYSHMKLPGRLEIDFFFIPRSLFHLLPAVSECVGSFLDLLVGAASFSRENMQ